MLAFGAIRPLSEEEFRDKIGLVARQLGRMRKAEQLVNHAALDSLITSTEEQMRNDWYNSIVFWLDRSMTRAFDLIELSPECYSHFESIWLDRVKEYRAYFHWVAERDSGPYWTSSEAAHRHYMLATEELRDLLISKAAKEPLRNFQLAQDYLLTRYLNSNSTVDPNKVGQLIELKAQRLVPHVGEREAIRHATEYVADFYNNIIPAIIVKDRACILNVLKAFIDAGSRPGAPDIVNGFEALLAILFLDCERIEDLWANGNISRDSVF